MVIASFTCDPDSKRPALHIGIQPFQFADPENEALFNQLLAQLCKQRLAPWLTQFRQVLWAENRPFILVFDRREAHTRELVLEELCQTQNDEPSLFENEDIYEMSMPNRGDFYSQPPQKRATACGRALARAMFRTTTLPQTQH